MVEIPREKIPEGIKRSVKEIERYLSDAKLLIENKSLRHALIMVQFAIEELGRVNILKKRFEEAESKDIVEVEDILFGGRGSHKYKEDEAWRLLDSELRTIHEGDFNRRDFSRDFDVDEVLNHSTRLEITFVAWDESTKDWKILPTIDAENVQELIRAIERKLSDLALS
jgi:AbiV family abortive infection protein